MRCFTFIDGWIYESITVHEDSKLGFFVGLGNGQNNKKIYLYKKYPPEVDMKISSIFDVDIIVYNNNIFLTKPRVNNNGLALVRIYTGLLHGKIKNNDNSSRGSWTVISGNPNNLVVFSTPHFDDGLVTMSSGDILRVQFESGGTPSHILSYDDGVLS